MVAKSLGVGLVASIAGTANAAFVGGVIRVDAAASVEASAEIGSAVTVTRMYIAFDEADDRLISIGNAEFHGVADLFQTAFGGDNQGQINPAFFPITDAEWDSYVGIGGPNFAGSGFGDSTDPDFMWASGGVAAGGWFTTPDGAGTFPGSGNLVDGYYEVFAGQFTLLGDFADDTEVGDGFIHSNLFFATTADGMGMDINWVEAAGESLSVNRVDFALPPAPGTPALFGIAGFAATRRRR